MIKMYSYNNASEGARLLCEALGIKRLKHKGSKYKPSLADTLINWGVGIYNPNFKRVLNDPDKVRRVTNKLSFFRTYLASKAVTPSTFDVPPYFFSKEDASRWLREEEGTRTLVCRTIVDGHEGAGIILCTNPLDIPNAPLYTGYVKKQAEYRIHVSRKPNGEYVVIDQTQKVKKRGVEGDFKIRNTANGFIFIRNGIEVPECVVKGAKEAVCFFDLDFGAVDVIYNRHNNKAYVLEINTAPGIAGATVQKYTQFFKEFE